jgi:3'-5' exoribonuclease
LFLEAMLLHHLDNLDSKMECMRGMVARDVRVEGCWTGYSAALDRSVLKKTKFLEEAEPAEPEATQPPPVTQTKSSPAGHGAAPIQKSFSVLGEKLQQALHKD